MSTELPIGSTLGSYEILRRMKSGGMGTLYLARRQGPRGFSRRVAIKVVHDRLLGDPKFLEEFLDEARLCAHVHQPNVIHAEELGHEGSHYFLVMEYIPSVTLAQLLRRLAESQRILSPELALHIAIKVAEALHAIHEARDGVGRHLRIVHRDVSPENILIAFSGHIKLIDFGIAKWSRRVTDGNSLRDNVSYMAPEQARGERLDRTADVYALGLVLWELLTGRRMHPGGDDAAALKFACDPTVRAPSEVRGTLDPALDAAVMQALRLRLDERFQSVRALQSALGSAVPGARVVECEDVSALLLEQMPKEARRLDRLLPSSSLRTGRVKRKRGTVTARLTALDPGARANRGGRHRFRLASRDVQSPVRRKSLDDWLALPLGLLASALLIVIGFAASALSDAALGTAPDPTPEVVMRPLEADPRPAPPTQSGAPASADLADGPEESVLNRGEPGAARRPKARGNRTSRDAARFRAARARHVRARRARARTARQSRVPAGNLPLKMPPIWE